MNLSHLIQRIEVVIFRHRLLIIFLFAITTVFLGVKSTEIKLGASFSKNVPLNHDYMKTYLKHQKNFGGANSVLISVCDAKGDIFNEPFFTALKGVHDQLYFIPGVNRVLVKSLFSPSVRFVEVVEDGFAGGPVIPANFTSDAAGLAVVKGNIEKAGIVGRMIASDYSCAMVSTQILEINPDTGEKLDTLAFAKQLESQVRDKFETDTITVHIIGFAKMVGDVADGAKGVVVFFAIAIMITTVLVWFFCKSVLLTLLPICCSIIAVVWQIGLLSVLGFSIDPMSILLPFLVFAIGVSHGVQMINALGKHVSTGLHGKAAAQCCVGTLLVPGIVALLSDTIGFLTLLTIDIGIIRELAITASIGVAVVILTNLILLPVLASFIRFKPAYVEKISRPNLFAEKCWHAMANVTKTPVAIGVVVAAIALYALAAHESGKMRIGALHAGAPALHESSRYNQDTALITERYAITVDILKVLVETKADACTFHDVMDTVDQFQWRLENIEGVQSAISLPSVAKRVNAGYNEGNVNWRILPRNSQSLVQASARVETSTGLLNSDCSVMPIVLFLQDHKAETINRVIAGAKELAAEMETDEIKFKLASGAVGVMAATNEAVEAAQTPMMAYVYGAVIILCLISFRSVKATLSVVLPLYLVSTMAQALMVHLEIGLTVSTLPVIALGVGIGVDYGIYFLANMSPMISQGMPISQAYLQALRERGSAVLFTGVTLAIGVSTWVFSALKFQMDMGILLTFMFVVNMLGAIIVLPALCSLLWRDKKKG
ncbi:MAG: putative RND superfamily exporter protein [Phenylobacterium sp.]|jgi:predicted RND superfamily exporter protein